MLDIESYHERTSETVSRELCIPMDVPKGEHPNLILSVYVYYECMCVCILHTYLFIMAHFALESTSEDAVVHTLGAILKD